MKYTITRALAELKLLKSKYTKEVYQLQLVAIKHGSKLRSPYSQYKEEDFADQAKSSYQSVCDLERRIEEIKNEIDYSNFTTKVKVGDREMTIQEVLNYKNNVLGYKEVRLNTLKDLKMKATSDFDRALQENKNKVDKMSADKNAGGSTKNSGDIEQDALDFVEKAYAVSMIDPIKIDEEIKKLDEEITNFTSNIDFVLSESNSTTFIEIDD
jgi:dGTP triphosphohydrolase